MTSHSTINGKKTILFFAFLLFNISLGCTPGFVDTPERSSLPVQHNHDFFSYLQETERHPSLIAFSPTNSDPRPGLSYQLPELESLRADLRALRIVFDGLILYGYDANLTPLIISEAIHQNFKAILLGIWDPTSQIEIHGIASLINTHHEELALAVCLGNEGLSFHRYTMHNLLQATQQLKEVLDTDALIPITTSEPLAAYRHIEVRAFGDFIAPNIHPVFDAPKLGPVQAGRWVRERAAALAKNSQKPVLVKETGFPHGGYENFNLEKQALFWKAYLANGRLVGGKNDRGNWISLAAAFEAYPLEWKSASSGIAIEQYWGLLNADREPYPAFEIWRGTKTELLR